MMHFYETYNVQTGCSIHFIPVPPAFRLKYTPTAGNSGATRQKVVQAAVI